LALSTAGDFGEQARRPGLFCIPMAARGRLQTTGEN